jgi:hypothetical protein
MHVQFFATQSVHLDVPDEAVPIQHYLRQPQRLVYALVDPSRTEQLQDNIFRLKMRPLRFMMLQIQPTVDMQVWTEADGSFHLRSVGTEIRGNQYINQRFQLDLQGQLYARQRENQTQLQGKADLRVQVMLPPLLQLTPRPVIEKTGNSLLNGILLTIKQRLMHQLMQDYQQWARATDSKPAEVSPGLPAHPPVV